MTLRLARHYAEKLAAWIAPHCAQIEVAGSIRRARPECADVDIVAVPKITDHKDMLGATIARSNHAWDFLTEYVKDRNPLNSPGRKPRFISGGDREGKQVLMELPKCQLDLWFATPETWATILLCRTGSKDHNIWIAERATERGLHWNPYEGLYELGPHSLGERRLIPLSTEEAFYRALSLAFIHPMHRELAWLKKHVDSGLCS